MEVVGKYATMVHVCPLSPARLCRIVCLVPVGVKNSTAMLVRKYTNEIFSEYAILTMEGVDIRIVLSKNINT
jgi:hypothetical protein